MLGHILKIFIAFALGLGVVLATVSSSYSASAEQQGEQGATKLEVARNKIQHVIVIMQENRSFDDYFGTYPGADGLPPNVCVPDPQKGGCQRPFHDTNDINSGGPHQEGNALKDIDGGKMDGFVGQREAAKTSCANPTNPQCAAVQRNDVMGY